MRTTPILYWRWDACGHSWLSFHGWNDQLSNTLHFIGTQGKLYNLGERNLGTYFVHFFPLLYFLYVFFVFGVFFFGFFFWFWFFLFAFLFNPLTTMTSVLVMQLWLHDECSISGTVGSFQSREAFTGRRALTIVNLLKIGHGRGHELWETWWKNT